MLSYYVIYIYNYISPPLSEKRTGKSPNCGRVFLFSDGDVWFLQDEFRRFGTHRLARICTHCSLDLFALQSHGVLDQPAARNHN